MVMTNRQLIEEVRVKAMGMEFSQRWLILELANRFERALENEEFVEDLSDGALD